MENNLKDKLNKLAESVANLVAVIGAKEATTVAEVKENEGEASMAEKTEVIETKAEEVKVEEVVEAKADEAKSEDVKTDEAKAEEVKAEVVETKAEEKTTETEVVKTDAEAAAEVVEESKAEAEVEKTEVVEEAAVVQEADAAKAEKIGKLKKAMCAEELEGLELTETELALATKFSYIDLVKFATELSGEVASFREAKAKAEADKRLSDRIATLSQAEILFAGEKGIAQKEEIKDMTEEAFASYVTKTQELKSVFTSEAGLEKTAVEAAKASVGSLSVEVKLAPKKLDYSKL